MVYSLIPTLVVNLVFKTFCSVHSEVISFGKFFCRCITIFSVFRIMEDFINKYSHSKSFNLVKLACGIKSTVSVVEFLQILLILRTYGFCVMCEAPTSKKVHFRQPGNFEFFRCLTCKKRISIRTDTFFQKGKISFRRFILLCYGWCEWTWKYDQVKKECCLTSEDSGSDSQVRSLSDKTIARYHKYFR